MVGSGTKGHTFTAPQITSAPTVLSHPPNMDTNPHTHPTIYKGGGTNLFLGKFLGKLTHRGCHSYTPYIPAYPQNTPIATPLYLQHHLW